MSGADLGDTGTWRARKAAQNRGLAEPSASSSYSSLIPGSASVPVRPGIQFSAKRANLSAKCIQPKEWPAKSTGSATEVIDLTSPSGQARESVQSTLLRPRHTLRKSPPTPNVYLSDFSLPAKKAKSSPLGRPARITSASFSSASSGSQTVDPALSVISATGAVYATPTKSYRSLPPLWQQLDNEHEERAQLSKRDRNGNALVKRISSRTDRRAPTDNAEVFQLKADDPNHVHAHIDPKLKLRAPGLPEESDSDDEPRYRPQARLAPNRKAPGNQLAVKAARKYRSVELSPESDNDNSDTSTSLSSSDKSTEEVDELDSDQYDSETKPHVDEDVEMEDVILESKIPEKLVFNTPPPITAPLPASPPRVDNSFDSEPSAALISAVQALTLPVIRMQTTRQLPFLLRNLRKGFHSRCRKLHIPIYHDGRDINGEVRYEHAGGGTYKAEVFNWQCPLCDLFGTFPTREMLDFHLKSDHSEVYCEWQERDDPEINSWKLQLVVPESSEPESSTVLDVEQRPQQFSSPFPSLSLSPPSQTPSVRELTPFRAPKKEAAVSLWFKREPHRPESSVTPSRTPETSSSIRRSRSAAGSVTTSTVRTPHPPNSRYPAPPPPENPLGPAATPPYFPAHSDYGGPTVYYSSRPGGPCLFDLLGTLPMEKFGLLDWEVLDREDEIYESDDVREEYKVMHALWARWIILNRNEFIANYYKGAIAFVDEYWKIIHKAAGWDALRYFLFILLANQFLNGHEVAQTLLHYEKHTGMALWYD